MTKINLYKTLKFISENKNIHKPNTKLFKFYKKKFNNKFIKKKFKKLEIKIAPNIEKITIPYYKLGNLNCSYLFGFNELIIMSYYLFNNNNYKKVIDIGANIGVHSIIFSRLKYKVKSFEPDDNNFLELKKNINLNKIKNINLNKMAISKSKGYKNFVRVCGNTTGNHLQGKKIPYGKLEIFKVKTDQLKKYLKGVNFVKIDAEGSEIDILAKLSKKNFINTEFMIELNSKENAKKLLKLSKNYNLNLFSQKIAWKKTSKIDDLPHHHSYGSVFVTVKNSMNW